MLTAHINLSLNKDNISKISDSDLAKLREQALEKVNRAEAVAMEADVSYQDLTQYDEQREAIKKAAELLNTQEKRRIYFESLIREEEKQKQKTQTAVVASAGGFVLQAPLIGTIEEMSAIYRVFVQEKYPMETDKFQPQRIDKYEDLPADIKSQIKKEDFNGVVIFRFKNMTDACDYQLRCMQQASHTPEQKNQFFTDMAREFVSKYPEAEQPKQEFLNFFRKNNILIPDDLKTQLETPPEVRRMSRS